MSMSDVEQFLTTSEAGVSFAIKAATFDDTEVTVEQRRKLKTLKQSLVMHAPQDAAKSAELANIGSELGSIYGKGLYTNKASKKLNVGDMTSIMAASRDYDELLKVWQGLRTMSPAMKTLFARQSVLANQGVQGLGYQNLDTMWRSNYDMAADDFAKELDQAFI